MFIFLSSAFVWFTFWLDSSLIICFVAIQRRIQRRKIWNLDSLSAFSARPRKTTARARAHVRASISTVCGGERKGSGNTAFHHDDDDIESDGSTSSTLQCHSVENGFKSLSSSHGQTSAVAVVCRIACWFEMLNKHSVGLHEKILLFNGDCFTAKPSQPEMTPTPTGWWALVWAIS